MRTTRSMLAVAAAALVVSASVAHADARAPRTDRTARTGSVKALSIVPATGRAEVVIAVDGQVEVQDFILTKPNRIVLDLNGATLGTAPRLYDKIARGGITNVRLAQYREDIVRIVVDLDSPREYQVVRGENDVRVSISGATSSFNAWHSAQSDVGSAFRRPAAPAATPRSPAPATSGRTALPRASQPAMGRNAYSSAQARITVTYQDADIRDVLAAFAAFSGRTIVVGKTVAGQISAEIRDQPWDVALQAILSSQGLAAAEDQYGIITVDSYANILAKQASEPLVTQLVSINYAKASSLVGTIQSLLAKDCAGGTAGGGGAPSAGACLTRGTVTADTGTNTLLITEVPSRINDLIGYVKDLDVRTPQVAIKAKIIFVQRTDVEQMGLSYDLGTAEQFSNRLVQRIDPLTGQPYDVQGTPGIISLGGDVVTGIANAKRSFQGTAALDLVFSTMLGKFSLTAWLDALQEVRLSDTQAEPSIVTLDNRPASILVGQETPIRVIDAGTGGGTTRSNVQFKESGIILQVTPHITNNRQILMEVHAEQSQLEAAAADLGFTFQKRRADNQLLVADGQTAVIGGLTLTEVTASKSGIPLLVDLPLIGRLFGETQKQEVKRDLLILITPHIVDEGEAVGTGDQR